MGFDSQTCFILKEIGSNLDKKHIVFTVKILFEIFKEIRPELFKKNKKTRPGPKWIYKTGENASFLKFWTHYGNNKLQKARKLVGK